MIPSPPFTFKSTYSIAWKKKEKEKLNNDRLSAEKKKEETLE